MQEKPRCPKITEKLKKQKENRDRDRERET